MADEQKADEQKPMPQWIKQSRLPESTKQYFYKLWLNGDISPKAPEQDWGAITDVVEFFKKIKFKNDAVKNEITTEPLLRKKLDANQIDTDLAAAQKALDDGVANYKYNKQVYSLTDLRDKLIPELNTLKEQAADQQSKQETAKFIASSQLSADENFAKSALKKFKDKEITEKELKAAQAAVTESKLVLDRVRKGELASVIESPETGKYQVQFVSDVPITAVAKPSAVTPKVTGTPTAILSQQGRAATVAPMEDRAEQVRFARMKPTAKPTAVGATDTGGAGAAAGAAAGGAGAGVSVAAAPVIDVAKRTTFVNEQLAARGLENTPANREMLRKEYKTAAAAGKTPETAAVSTAWETTFRETFPAKAWLLDLDRTKYPQLFQLLNTAISQEWYKSQEGLTRFTASLDATDFYKEISQSKQLKTIQSLVGTLGFEGSDFTKFVSDSINFGYQGEVLKQKVYEQVFKKDDAGNYINPTALERTKKSADYISTQNIAKAFFNTNPADSDIEKVLTGQMLTADYERQQREFAKTRYGHLSNLLDQGMTLESIASAYKTTASRLLELNPNAIDMSTGAFEQAVTFGEEGKKRLMTNSEWEKLLRTDPQYGWEKTNNAKDEARALSANIAQAFGRIL